MKKDEEQKTVNEEKQQEEPAAAEETPKPEKKKPAKKEKEGLFARGKAWCKRNKNALIAGGAGVATGVAGTIAVSEFGKRRAEKNARRNACLSDQSDYSPLDPNV